MREIRPEGTLPLVPIRTPSLVAPPQPRKLWLCYLRHPLYSMHACRTYLGPSVSTPNECLTVINPKSVGKYDQIQCNLLLEIKPPKKLFYGYATELLRVY